MEQYVMTPFNIELLILDKSIEKMLGRVYKTNIFETPTQNFDANGLFSTEIFGPIGSEDRNDRFGYIDLGIKVFHPLVFEHISTLKSFYKDIITGTKHAKFDNKLNDFVPATMEDGSTGFAFFMKYVKDIKLESTGGDQRDFKIKLLNLYHDDNSLLDKWLVLPAGLRDYIVSEDGKTSEDEVNDIYRKLITTTNLLLSINVTPTTEHTVDNIRLKIQLLTVELYEHFKVLLDGKNKFIQGKWAKRAIVNGTRNVLTPAISNITRIDQTNMITSDHTICGLYQYVRAITPIAMNKIHTKFISKIMNVTTSTVMLVNSKTMKSELMEISVKKRDEWLTIEGLDDVFGKLEQEDIRSLPIKLENNYLFLVHDKDDVITVIFNTADIPEDMDRSYIRPITYYELLYISIHDCIDIYPGFITRYPVANLGGIYPSKMYVRCTENPRVVDVVMNGTTTRMYEYPNLTEQYINSVSASPTHIQKLGADSTKAY